jgi:surface antigen
MPNSYGHAKDFFDHRVKDAGMNRDRDLVQYTDPSATKSAVGDLLVLDGWPGNQYGHVAIVGAVRDGRVEVVQQNTGSSRQHYDLDLVDGKWRLDSRRVMGWMRK